MPLVYGNDYSNGKFIRQWFTFAHMLNKPRDSSRNSMMLPYFSDAAIALDLKGNIYIIRYGNSDNIILKHQFFRDDILPILTGIIDETTVEKLKGKIAPEKLKTLKSLLEDKNNNVGPGDLENLNFTMEEKDLIISNSNVKASEPIGKDIVKQALNLTIDFDGNIFIADIGNHCIHKFDSSGKFITKFGSFGSGDGEFNLPESVAVDRQGNVYVIDVLNYRIQKFAPKH